MEFEWDADKESENIRKHCFTFAEAVEAFLDPHGFPLEMRSTQTQRVGTIG